MFLLGESYGWRGQEKLWSMRRRGLLEIVDLPGEAVDRTVSLMEKYADTPMSLADASLVSLAELRNLDQIFTLDSDFTVYRLHGRRLFQVIPAPR